MPHSVARGFAEAGGDDHQDRDVEETEEMDIDKYPVYPDVFDCLEMHCHDGCYVDWHDRDLVALNGHGLGLRLPHHRCTL